jgi:hypothetical protein
MKESGTWPKELAFTKCSDFTEKDSIVRPNLDLRQAMKSVSITIKELQNNELTGITVLCNFLQF